MVSRRGWLDDDPVATAPEKNKHPAIPQNLQLLAYLVFYVLVGWVPCSNLLLEEA